MGEMKHRVPSTEYPVPNIANLTPHTSYLVP